jgi:hypothetical protein
MDVNSKLLETCDNDELYYYLLMRRKCQKKIDEVKGRLKGKKNERK